MNSCEDILRCKYSEETLSVCLFGWVCITLFLAAGKDNLWALSFPSCILSTLQNDKII